MIVSRVAAACAATSLLSFLTTTDAAYSNDYEYDGKTVYCVWMDQGMGVTSLDTSYIHASGSGSECPLALTIKQENSGVINAGEPISYSFEATLSMDDNVFDMTGLQATVTDPTTRRPVQIGHANVHACDQGTICDIFTDGANRKISPQETSNFTASGKADFSQELTFDEDGDYNIFAHIILPPVDPNEEAYHFMTFTKATVGAGETTTTNADSGEDGEASHAAMIGVIVAAAVVLLALVAFVLHRRKKKTEEYVEPRGPNGELYDGSAYAQSSVTKPTQSVPDWGSGGTHTQDFATFHMPQSNFSNTSNPAWEQNQQPPGLSASALTFDYNAQTVRSASQWESQRTLFSNPEEERRSSFPKRRASSGQSDDTISQRGGSYFLEAHQDDPRVPPFDYHTLGTMDESSDARFRNDSDATVPPEAFDSRHQKYSKNHDGDMFESDSDLTYTFDSQNAMPMPKQNYAPGYKTDIPSPMDSEVYKTNMYSHPEDRLSDSTANTNYFNESQFAASDIRSTAEYSRGTNARRGSEESYASDATFDFTNEIKDNAASMHGPSRAKNPRFAPHASDPDNYEF